MNSHFLLALRDGLIFGVLGSVLVCSAPAVLAADPSVRALTSERTDPAKGGVGATTAEGTSPKKAIEAVARPQIAKPGDALPAKSNEGLQKAGDIEARRGEMLPKSADGALKSGSRTEQLLSGPASSSSPGGAPASAPPSPAPTGGLGSPSATRSGRTINEVTVPAAGAGVGAGAAAPRGASPKSKAGEGSAEATAAGDPLETRVRTLFDERLSKDGEVILRVSPETPLSKGGLLAPGAGRTSAASAGGRTPAVPPAGRTSAVSAAGSDAGATSSGEREKAWDWTGPRGPQHWGRLDPANLACAQGKMQSPPSIGEAMVISSTVRMPILSRGDAGFAWKRDGPLWSVLLTSTAYLTWREELWRLEAVQFRFPGEPFVGGSAPRGTIHLIHRKEGRFLILAAPLAESEQARRHAGLTTLLQRFPMDANDRPDWSSLRIDPATLLPAASHSGIAFTGSLSHPPCTEGVFWILLDQAVALPMEQIRELEALLGRGHRPVQESGNRLFLRLQALEP